MHIMYQYRWFGGRRCLFGVSSMTELSWGVHLEKPLNEGQVIGLSIINVLIEVMFVIDEARLSQL